jgi:hypothetical protein
MEAIEIGSTSWYVVLLFAGLAVGVAIAIARVVFGKNE